MSEPFEDWDKIQAFIESNPQLHGEELMRALKADGLMAADRPLIQAQIGQQLDQLLHNVFDQPPTIQAADLQRYRLLEKIAEGGQSEIYLAKRADGLYQKTVVIKFLHAHSGQHFSRQQFLQEMQILADLRHPYIVPILDAGHSEDGRPWLALEYIDGPTLDAHVKTQPCTRNEVLALMLKICEALEYIHEHHIVHMDIKPGNILVEHRHGIVTPVLVDFGISVNPQRWQEHPVNAAFGTPGFMAPEQLQGQAIDARVDVYACGAMLYLLLKGLQQQALTDVCAESPARHPFHADEEFARALPADVHRVIELCLQRRVERRYASITALKNDLYSLMHGLPIAEKSNRIGHVLGKSIRRHKGLTAVALLLCATAIGFSLKYTHDIRQQKIRAEQARNASDGLLNFMLQNLYEKLDNMGKTDLLLDITEQSLAHLRQFEGRVDDPQFHWHKAQNYVQIARVLMDLKLHQDAQQALLAGRASLDHLRDAPEYRALRLGKLAKIGALLSTILTQQNRLDEAEAELHTALANARAMAPADNAFNLWETLNLLAWHHLENASGEQALRFIEESIELSQANLQRKPDDVHNWHKYLSQSHQAMAWYQLDYGTLSLGLDALRTALRIGEQAVDLQNTRIDLHNNLRVLHNNMAFFLLEQDDHAGAREALDKAIEMGQRLGLRSPENRNFKRELAYSYNLMTEVLLAADDVPLAREYSGKSLAISADLVALDPGNDSAANDYSMDLMQAANIDAGLGLHDAARSKRLLALEAIRPVVEKSSDSIYYVLTMATALLHTGHIDQAHPWLDKLRAHGVNSRELNDLLLQHRMAPIETAVNDSE